MRLGKSKNQGLNWALKLILMIQDNQCVGIIMKIIYWIPDSAGMTKAKKNPLARGQSFLNHQ